jgi:hypothetical protein
MATSVSNKACRDRMRRMVFTAWTTRATSKISMTVSMPLESPQGKILGGGDLSIAENGAQTASSIVLVAWHVEVG